MSDKKDYQFPLRLPPGLRDRIKSEAEANGRSLNSEILYRLEQGFGSDPRNLIFSDLDESDRSSNEPDSRSRTLFSRGVNVDLMATVYSAIADLNSTRLEPVSHSRLMYFTAIGYNELLSLVGNPDDKREVEAFLPAVRYRVERAMEDAATKGE